MREITDRGDCLSPLFLGISEFCVDVNSLSLDISTLLFNSGPVSLSSKEITPLLGVPKDAICRHPTFDPFSPPHVKPYYWHWTDCTFSIRNATEKCLS